MKPLRDALLCERLGEDRLVLVVAPAHPRAQRDRVAPHELAQAEWVLRGMASPRQDP